MKFWNIRNEALEAINKDLEEEQKVVETCFTLLDKLNSRFIAYAQINNEYTRFAAVCSQILTRTRRLGIGCYSLCLDGLTLEAGSLGRLLLEAWQLLVYFHKQPERIELVFQGKLPAAGTIARDLQEELHEQLKGLRDYYNANCAHFSFNTEVLVTVNMIFNAQELRGNMRNLFLLMSSILIDALRCLAVINSQEAKSLDPEITACNHNGIRVFATDEETKEE